MLFKVGHHANHIIHVTHARPFGLLCPEAISYTYARLATTPYVICCCVMQGHIIYICQANQVLSLSEFSQLSSGTRIFSRVFSRGMLRIFSGAANGKWREGSAIYR